MESSKFIYRDKYARTGWLNMMQERLKLAKKLLSDEGVIFISIDDNEQAYLKVLCDEIFGEESGLVPIIWDKCNAQNDARGIQKNHEYILCYCSGEANFKDTQKTEQYLEQDDNGYFYLGSGLVTGGAGGTLNQRPKLGYSIYLNEQTKDFIAIDDYDKELARTSNNEALIYRDNQEWIAKGYNKIIRPPKKHKFLGCWTWKLDKFNNNKKLIHITKNYAVLQKIYIENESKKESIVIDTALPPKSIIKEVGGTRVLNSIFDGKVFDNPKPVSLIKHLLKITSKPNSIILDFFAGSGTTGQAVMELNEEDGRSRQCILVTNNQNNIGTDITHERLYRVCNGVGTKGETFKWEYSKDKKCLPNNIWHIFDMEDHHLDIQDYEKAQQLLEEAQKELKKLNNNWQAGDFDIYHQLASLNPYKTESK